jgi:hypothetical protein
MFLGAYYSIKEFGMIKKGFLEKYIVIDVLLEERIDLMSSC